MSLSLTRATTSEEAAESDPHDAVSSNPASRVKRTRDFITEHSIFLRNNGYSSTQPALADGQGDPGTELSRAGPIARSYAILKTLPRGLNSGLEPEITS